MTSERAGRDEIGRTDPVLLTGRIEGPRLLLLGGRSWQVTWIDWKRRRCFVEPAKGGGRARWLTEGALAGLKFSVALPRHLAVATLATRLADLDHAAAVLGQPCLFESAGGNPPGKDGR